jgi:hypothetical protein
MAIQKILLQMTTISNLDFIRKNYDKISEKLAIKFTLNEMQQMSICYAILELSSFWVALDQMSVNNEYKDLIKGASNSVVEKLNETNEIQALSPMVLSSNVSTLKPEDLGGMLIADFLVLRDNLEARSSNPVEMNHAGLRAVLGRACDKIEIKVVSNDMSTFDCLGAARALTFVAKLKRCFSVNGRIKRTVDDKPFADTDLDDIINNKHKVYLVLLLTTQITSINYELACSLINVITGELKHFPELGKVIEVLLIFTDFLTFLLYDDKHDYYYLGPKYRLKKAFEEDKNTDKIKVKEQGGFLEFSGLLVQEYRNECCNRTQSCEHGLNHRDLVHTLSSFDPNIRVK